jgi:soluble lytic murein transglycosylase-like protein
VARLTILFIALALAFASAPVAASVDRWRPLIAEASERFGVPASWIERVMRVESGGVVDALSPKGAQGLMQLMPGTWAAMRRRLGLGTDPYDPHDNVLAGTLYLRLLYQQFGYPGLFAAYNAGPSRYADHLAGKRSLPLETRAYVAAVAGLRPPMFPIGAAARSPRAFASPRVTASLFFPLSNGSR